ncbi:hypothetical protein SAMN05892877_101355 [Rhizobium subbaraonis]|uniref:Uncharacterized protein n=1 Tax=Rhizobium subbaraonis TaxID=908946 RepID=A0A285U4I8_9HYPH|nr:hypothetical protein [Rhizobium subbaraonis]SOC35436.1 hypothetical protein SAMN05892877_101355 [Rhizobium subbaraonis]
MKIGSDNLLANYTLARQTSSKREDNAGSSGESGVTRTSAPSIAPTMPQTSAFSSALWTIGADKSETTSKDTGVVEEFQELAKMTPAERLRKQMLEEMGLTEDSLKTLPPEERKAIEAEIRDAIEQQFGVGAAGENIAELKTAAEV